MPPTPRGVVLHVPHASRVIPPDARASIVLDDAELERELDRMTDSFTDRIADLAVSFAGTTVPAPALGATPTSPTAPALVAAPVSRLVVDVERFPDEREVMNDVGMGAVYTATHDLHTLRDAVDPALIARYFEPHARRVSDAVDAQLDRHGEVVVLDVHSYPSVRLPYERAADDAPRPQVCLGVDDAHTPDWLVGAARESFNEFETGINSPFAGTYVPLKHYGIDRRVSSLMIEIRRDVYMDERAVAPNDGLERIAVALADLVRRSGAW